MAYPTDELSRLIEAFALDVREIVEREELLCVGQQLHVQVTLCVESSARPKTSGQLSGADALSSFQRLSEIRADLERVIRAKAKSEHLLQNHWYLRVSFEVRTVEVVTWEAEVPSGRKTPVSLDITPSEWAEIESLPWGQTPATRRALRALVTCKSNVKRSSVWGESGAINKMFSDHGLPFRMLRMDGVIAKRLGVNERDYLGYLLFRVK
jgi:hypothetical protein